MPIIIFQHSDVGRPGRLGLTLRDQAFRLDIRRPDRGDPIPPDFDNVDAVVSLGGPQNVGDDHAWLAEEKTFLRAAHERELPVVGVSLGAELIAAALGGEVGQMDKPEIGFHTVSLNTTAQIEPVFSGIAWDTPQFCHHACEIKTLPPGATPLASSKLCKVQAFIAGVRTIGFQFHFEADRPMIADLIRSFPRELSRSGATEAELHRQADTHYQFFARMADRLCLNLAAYIIGAPRTASTEIRRAQPPTNEYAGVRPKA